MIGLGVGEELLGLVGILDLISFSLVGVFVGLSGKPCGLLCALDSILRSISSDSVSLDEGALVSDMDLDIRNRDRFDGCLDERWLCDWVGVFESADSITAVCLSVSAVAFHRQ